MQTDRGKVGENLVVEYLRHFGCVIRAQNWRTIGGEIDIIAERNGVIMFIEVKTRTDDNAENAFASLTPRKRETLIRAVETYLSKYDLSEREWRIDVIAVVLRPDEPPLIEHVEDALGW